MLALVPEVVTYGEYTTGRRIAAIVTIIPAVLLLLGWFVISKYELSDRWTRSTAPSLPISIVNNFPVNYAISFFSR